MTSSEGIEPGIVNELSENYRTVVVLSDREGLTNAGIGDVLGLCLETIKKAPPGQLALKKFMDLACELYQDERSELSCDRF